MIPTGGPPQDKWIPCRLRRPALDLPNVEDDRPRHPTSGLVEQPPDRLQHSLPLGCRGAWWSDRLQGGGGGTAHCS